jgi:anthraniloyl-CoA monooxygenase
MTDISPLSRITPGCAGIWNDQQEESWKRIVEFVHNHTAAKFAMQLGHAGAKGATKEPWNWHPDRLDDPLPPEQAWPLVSASAIAYDSYCQVPAEINRQQMDEVRDQFVAAAVRADRAGFDMLELHAAHGYLLSAFITPIMNHRNDRYGGNLNNRLRYPLEVFSAIREIWPDHKPISVRISAHDWMQAAGNNEDDAVAIARAFTAVGADAIDVSSGQVSHLAQPRSGRMFQTPLSDRIRNETGIATMAVGNIYELDHVNSIIAAGRADLVCLGRPHLADPNWTLRAAASMDYNGIGVNEQHQYHLGYRQLQTNLQRADEMAAVS